MTEKTKYFTKNDMPKILKEYNDVYFIYKPPFWNCATDYAYKQLKKYIGDKKMESNLILDWIKENTNTDKESDVKHLKYGYGLLNRLDLETSGIIMVAKNRKKYLEYRKNINDHIKTTKIYITLVNGYVEHDFGVITLPLKKNDATNIIKVDEQGGKSAYTEYIKLRKYEHNGNKYTLLLVKIKTGRTHQIRVHMESIGHSVICDRKYEARTTVNDSCKMSHRLFLHAYYYNIGDNLDSQTDIPIDLQSTIAKMKLIKEYSTFENALHILKSNVITNKFLGNISD